MPGRALVTPEGMKGALDADRALKNLVACFRVADDKSVRRKPNSQNAKGHGFTMVTSTAKSAGGSGQ
jgi:hypothetical protein